MSQGSYTNLTQLLGYLQQQAAANGTATLDDTFLKTAQLTAMQAGLTLANASLALQDLPSENITLSEDQTTITIAGATATDQVLNLAGAPISVAIQQTTPNSATGYDLIVNVGLAATWTLGTSFPKLDKLQLPDYLTFASGPFLCYSSFAKDPAIANFPAPHGAGLNYTAAITPAGIFGAIAALLKPLPQSLPIAGIIVPDPIEFDLMAPVTTQATIDLDFIEAYTSAPWLGIRVVDASGSGGDSSKAIHPLALVKGDGDDDAPATPALLYYVGVNVSVQNQGGTAAVDFEVDIQIPAPGTTTFDVALKPSDDAATALSLGNLSHVLFNSDSQGSAITNAVAPLGSVISSLTANITLKNFSATFDIGNFSIQSVTGLIGTSTAGNGWTPGLPGLPEIELDLNWFIPFSTNAWTVDFSATLTIQGSKPLVFKVDVAVPSEVITGTETGSVSIGLQDLGTAFGADFQNLGDVASLTFTNFTITADIPNKLYTVSGTLALTLNLFGVQLLSVQDMNVDLEVQSGDTTTYTFKFDGTIVLGSLEIAASGTVTNDPKVHTVFTMHLVHQTVGSMLNNLVQLVDPSYTLTFDAPWDAFFNLSLDALVLTVDVTAGSVGLTYSASLNLGFIEIDSIGLTYTKAQGTTSSSVKVELTGSFLGQKFDTNNPLAWDAVNEAPPAAPAPKPPVFDLVYAGLGQHVAINDPADNIAGIMKQLQTTVIPVQAGAMPSIGPGQTLQFSADSNWLIGAQFTVAGTVSISAIFNDPTLYGILISLGGDKAKSFAGLSFEILYRKVTDSIGVYHIELKLPDAMRNLQFGEVAVVLPVVVLDIYTNGNFRVDFGFPVGLDFSNSFSVQVFPFVGYGGFYFALLDGATSSKVPKISNGDWSPVIEFGIALSLGVGKTIDEGILSGGISVTVIGILQGVLAWFHPKDNSNKEMYYWFQGSISIVGNLYATIDFGIIQASLDVTAYATVTLTIEAHQPIYISINAGVSVEVKVKIIFFTVHFSFKATVSASFTIGSATPTPWILAGGGSSSTLRALAPRTAVMLAGQPRLHAAHVSAMMARPGFLRAMRKMLVQAPGSLLTWPAFNVFPGQTTPQPLTLYGMPGFTKNGTSTTSATAVFLLTAQNSVPPAATTAVACQALADPEAAAVVPFNLLMQAMLSWGIWVIQNPTGSNSPAPPVSVTADQLEQLNKTLKDPATIGAAFDYTTLTNFLGANFNFTVTPADSSEQGVAVFPVFPALTLSDNGLLTTPVNFSTPTVDSEYAAKVRAYFALLQVQFQSRNQSQSASPKALAAGAPAPAVSMAQVVFSQYFNMLMSAGVQAAIDLLASYAYTTTAAFSIAEIGTAIGDSTLSSFPMRAVTANQDLPVLNAGAQLLFTQVTHQIAANDTWTSVVQAFNAMKVLNTEGAAYTVSDLVNANLGTSGIYSSRTTLAFRGLSYTTLANESFQTIAARLLVRAGSPGLLNAIEGVAAMTQQLQALNTSSLPWVANPNTPIPGDQAVTLPAGTYRSVANGTDTLAMIAGYLCYAAQANGPATAFAAQIAAMNPGVSTTPPANTSLQMPPVSRTLAASDSIDSLTDLLLAEGAQIIANITAPAGSPYTSQAGDTLNVLAARALVTAGGAVLVNALPGLADGVLALGKLNPAIKDATVAIAAGTTITLPANAIYTTVAGDTLTLVEAYQLEIGAAATPVAGYVAQMLAINTLSVTDPTAPQAPGTVILPPPADALLAAPGVLQVPLIYPIQAPDTLAGIASKFNLTLQEVADAANGPSVFAANQAITISDVESIGVPQLLTNLLEQAEFNNASGMVSRFLLSGLQLPDPKSNFENLTIQQLQDPTVLGTIPTLPMYQLTGQQYTVTAPVPATYEITLVNNASAPWLQFPGGTPGSSTPFSFPLTSDAITQANAIAAENFKPSASVLTRLALFQMTPSRIPLQNQISWQAATLPAGFTGGTPGSPDIWLFPDSLVLQLQNAAPPPLRYQVAVAKDATPDTPVNAAPAQQYLWGTIVDFDIALPAVDGPAASVANTYVINGADDTGAALLQAVFNQIQGGADTATLYLLYSPANNASGLISDNVNAAATYILKTNLSTVTNPHSMMSLQAVQFDPDTTYAGALNDAVSFVALLFEASVTRSGGFYLNYFNGTAALPSTVFGNSSTAAVSLLVMLNSQNSPDSPILPFNNCAVVLDNIDPTTSTVFVQPAIYVVQAGDSFTSAASAFNTAYSASFTPAQVAAFNQAVPQVLLPGASMTLPNSGAYTIQYGDTLVSIAQAKGTDPVTLAGLNLTVAILSTGSPMQFAANVLSPATTVPPGTTGFEMTMPNNSADEVGSLFNMLGFNIAPAGGFLKSGAGLPTTPSSSSTPSANGLGTNPPADDPSASWYFTQSMAVAPFATTQHGSASPALPPAAQNPYNGVGPGVRATIELALLDIYGNSMPIPGAASLSVPVGYYDDIISLGSWPSMATSYTVSGTSPAVTFDMSMQQARYIPQPGVAVDSALQSVAADFDTYTKIYYQLAQPDFFFTAQTTLDRTSMAKAYSISSLPFDAFARGAYIYLAALNPLQGAQFTATASGTGNEVASVAAQYGVTGAQLFTANQNQSFITLFGTPAENAFPLQVPLMYATANGDTLQSIATAQGTTVTELATMNSGVALAAGADLAAARAGVTAAATDSLASIATRAQASAAGLVTANPTQAILVTGATFTVGTKSFTLGAGQSFTDAANGLGVTLTALANANQYLSNIFVDNAALNVGDIVAQQGDTLQSIAAACGTDAATLANNNEAVVNLYPTATALQIGMLEPANVDWHPDDTLATLAQYNKVTVEQLGTANQTASAVFVDLAVVAIPGVLNAPQSPACTYTAGSADTLGGIAVKFGQQDASGLAELNPDLPGLFAGSQPISSGGQTVTTSPSDTFVSIQSAFQKAGVTLTLAQLAAAMAPLTGLIQPGGLWICPPMLGNAGGLNSTGTLAGLAAAYNTGAVTLGTANAAVLGFVAGSVSMNSAQWPGTVNPLKGYVTNGFETLNSLTNRVNQTGFTLNGSAVTVAQLIAAVSAIAGLVAPAAQVLPVPPPNPPANAFAITPGFTAPVFQISVNVISGRLQTWVDDDFKTTQSVYQSNYKVSPNPDPGSQAEVPTYSLTNFATVLQAAIPGLKVATGDAVSEGDPASAATIWGVNTGSNAGPQISYQFGAGSAAQYFALPPLCTSQLGGPVGIYPYTSGAGIDKTDQPVSQTFQSVDLDDWMKVFLDTLDLFLTPSYASAAYAVDPGDTLGIIGAKGALAGAISKRMEYVLQSGSGGSLADAVEAMQQAMLTQLGSAYTIDTLVQVPVTVSNASSTMEARLSGKLQLQANGVQGDPSSIPDAYSFSTAKVELPISSAGAAENATFLFSVKSPAAHKSATLPLEYVITDLELPSASETIGDYEGSNWLKFVLPLDNTQTQIGQVEIPIPLRSYPSPVLLVSQTAAQTVANPQTATDLLGWNLDYIYQHTDAEQDTPTVVVKFNPPAGSNAMSGATAPNAVTQQIFQALAQFMAAYPILKDDLALLPTAPPSTNLKAFYAVQSLSAFAAGVIQAFVPPASLFFGSLQTIIYAYQFQKVNTSDGTYLQNLVVTSVDPTTGQPAQNPTQLWPAIYEYYEDEGGQGTALTQEQPAPNATQVKYTYPANTIPAGSNFAQQFFFGGVPADTTLHLPAAVSLPSPQVFQMNNQNVLNLQSARAGVSITRNLSLVGTPQNPNPTNPDFVYQTPLTSFTGSAVPYVFAGEMIEIADPSIPTVAGALGLFLKNFFTTQNQWQAGQTVNIRLSAAYSYALATSTVDSQTQLGGLVPIVLVPDYAFNPVSNGNQPADWDATNPASFVSQLGLVFDDPIKGWFVTNNPVSTNAFYIFDVAIYADTGDMQPLVRAASLSFSLAAK